MCQASLQGLNKNVADMVKLHAHKILHGSMKDHCKKLGRFITALTGPSPKSIAPWLHERSLQKAW